MDCVCVKVVHYGLSFYVEHPGLSFYVEHPGFASAPGTNPPSVSAPYVLLPPSAASLPSTPSTGDSALRLCPRCHGRMSSVARDKHSFCCKCRGADCNLQNRSDDCMSRSMEEMESYVRCVSLLLVRAIIRRVSAL